MAGFDYTLTKDRYNLRNTSEEDARTARELPYVVLRWIVGEGLNFTTDSEQLHLVWPHLSEEARIQTIDALTDFIKATTNLRNDLVIDGITGVRKV